MNRDQLENAKIAILVALEYINYALDAPTAKEAQEDTTTARVFMLTALERATKAVEQ